MQAWRRLILMIWNIFRCPAGTAAGAAASAAAGAADGAAVDAAVASSTRMPSLIAISNPFTSNILRRAAANAS